MKNIKTFEDFVSNKENTKDVNEETEGKMYKKRLEDIAANAQKLLSTIEDGEDLEAWVQDKITIADHNMEAILGYYESGKKGDDKKSGEKPAFKGARMLNDEE
jgi:hypothetical protein